MVALKSPNVLKSIQQIMRNSHTAGKVPLWHPASKQLSNPFLMKTNELFEQLKVRKLLILILLSNGTFGAALQIKYLALTFFVP